jgi:flagellar motor switch protein FliN
MSSNFSNISVDLSVVLGTATMPVHQLLRMGRGAVIELDTLENEDVEILANDIPIARGQVILDGDRIGVSITEVLLRKPDFRPKRSVIRV